MLKLLILGIHFVSTLSNPLLSLEETCQQACHKTADDKINVHLIPHSHDDVGWLRTYEQYYEGTEGFHDYKDAGVSYILNSTIRALAENSERRFIQVETAFFWRWWKDQPDDVKTMVRDMVNKGQLEMVNGGWSMNDEATTNYQSIIDQFTWGFRILEETVGECGRPKIGWQIDPFGHSREHASLIKQLGFEGLVVVRIDYRDKEKRRNETNLEFIWNTNDNFEKTDAELFTTMFPDHYTYEKGFCFDVYCSDTINEDNVQDKVAAFASRLDIYKNYYPTKHLIFPMGGDFTYQKAEEHFTKNDLLIKGFKNHKTYNVFYSTPSCYMQAVKSEIEKNNIDLTTKNDDFFPYASEAHSFWSGYFTSRPTSKRFERTGNNILQSTKQLTTFSRINGNNDDDNIVNLRMAMGVLQHHDAITGTEKQVVAYDYHKILSEAIHKTEEPASKIIGDLLKKDANASVDLNLSYCLRANISICDNSKKERFIVAIQNPLSKTISHYVHLPVDGENYLITGPEEDGEIVFDIFDTIHSFDFVTDGTPASKELVFLAKDLPPLGVKLYYIEKQDKASDNYHKFEEITDNNRSFGDATNGFTLDEGDKLDSVTLDSKTLQIHQDFYFYTSSSGDQNSFRKSGAYIFRPVGAASPISKNLSQTAKFAKGKLLDQVLQVYDSEISQIIRVYKNSEEAHIELDWLVGDLQLEGGGKEVITKFTVDDFKSSDTFYTDANGRQNIKRTKNTRSDYDYDYTEEPIASNYYPVTSRIAIRDETQKLEVAVLNDRSQGGSSLADGEIELMVHRIEQRDDGYGVDEALQEYEYGKGLYARGKHYLTFGTTEKDVSSARRQRALAHEVLLSPVALVADATSDDLALNNVQDLVNFKFEGLKKGLPENVQILTLEPWKDSYILRLEHIFEKNEDTELSAETVVDLKGLFTMFEINELEEVTLGANQKIEESSNQSFSVFTKIGQIFKATASVDLKVTIKPMEIKTFIFKTNKNNKGGEYVGLEPYPYTNGAKSRQFSIISFVLLTIVAYIMS